MPRTLLLRFSDYETDTVGAHLRVISGSTHVWWGWWKKDHEPFPLDILQALAPAVPLEVGLIDRKSRRYYRATCEEMAFSGSGARLPSPETGLTPDYYQDSSHPAWFRLSSIAPISEPEWLELFGGFPEGDPSLFWVTDEESGPGIYPELEIPGEIETPGRSILHLSDLHFGEDHGFSTDDNVVGIDIPAMVDIICDRLDALGETIALVLVSGDLITKAGEESYSRDVQPMLERLLSRLQLEKDHIVIIPGNHDIEIAPDELSSTPTREYRHERRFRDFLRSFYGQDITEIESLRRVRTSDGWHISAVGLNSVRLRNPDTKEYGYVGHRSDPWLGRVKDQNYGRSLDELATDRVLNLVGLHHHLLPGELLTQPDKNRPVSLTLDAGRIVSDCQTSGVHLALHGHQHVPFLGSTSRARQDDGGWTGHVERLYVIGSGSSGAAMNRLSDELRENTFGVYQPQDGGIRVRVEQFNPTLTPRAYMEANIPL